MRPPTRGDGGVVFETFQLNSLNQQFLGFWGTHGPGYMGLAATKWVPIGAQVPNDHPNPSRGNRMLSEKVEFSKHSNCH